MKQFSGRFSAVLLAAMLMVTVNTGILQAQQEPVDRSFGLSASIQGGQTVILVPIWISESMNIAPGFGFSYLEGTGPLSGSRFTFFIIPHFFLDMGRIAPFISVRLGLLIDAPSGTGDRTDLLGGIGFGGEYFINPKFSLGVEAIMDGQILDAGGSNKIAISSKTAVNANIYF